MDWILSHPISVLLVSAITTAALMRLAAWRGSRSAWMVAAASGLGGLLLSVAGFAIETPGERGERVVASMIDRAVAGDARAAAAWFEEAAVIHFGGFDQPPMPRSEIDRDLRSLEGRHRVEHHLTTRIRGRTVTPELAEVDVGCLTRTQSSGMSVLTSWSFRVRLDPEGNGRIQAVSFDRLAGSQPRPGIF